MTTTRWWDNRAWNGSGPIMNTNHRPLVVALTGGIASGKTAVSDIFASLGVPIVDTDLIAREMV
ncbi:MAG: dephospho-CoA kinase, partial [Wenzhouxiangellaceae bacterium]